MEGRTLILNGALLSHGGSCRMNGVLFLSKPTGRRSTSICMLVSPVETFDLVAMMTRGMPFVACKSWISDRGSRRFS